MLDVPVLAKSSNHSLLNWPSASAADGDAHLVVAAEAVQVAFDLACLSGQLHTTSSAIEMVRVIRLTAELEWHVINDAVALVADVFATCCSLLLCIALMAQSPPSILDEALVGKWDSADLATETLWVPVVVHGLDDTANDEFTTLSTAGCEENMEVMLTVLAPLKLIKDAFGKWPEALATDKASLVPDFAVGVHDLLVGLEPVPTTGTSHIFKGHQEVCLTVFLHCQGSKCRCSRRCIEAIIRSGGTASAVTTAPSSIPVLQGR